MVKVRCSLVLLVLAGCLLTGLHSASSQTYTYSGTEAPTSCVDTIFKAFIPNKASPTLISIRKVLDVPHACKTVGANNASCRTLAKKFGAATRLVASATSNQIGLSPSCQWTCADCGIISITSAGDDLPIELMDFTINDHVGSTGEDPEADEDDEGLQ